MYKAKSMQKNTTTQLFLVALRDILTEKGGKGVVTVPEIQEKLKNKYFRELSRPTCYKYLSWIAENSAWTMIGTQKLPMNLTEYSILGEQQTQKTPRKIKMKRRESGNGE